MHGNIYSPLGLKHGDKTVDAKLVGRDASNDVALLKVGVGKDELHPVTVGDSSKARERLGWEPTVRFHALIRMMVDADLARHAGTT